MSRIAALLKVRTESKLGLQICQKALESSNWDSVKALNYLNEWSKQENLKTNHSNSLKEGACSFYESESDIILSKIKCKTDFVARNEEFQKLFFMVNNSLLFDTRKIKQQQQQQQSLHDSSLLTTSWQSDNQEKKENDNDIIFDQTIKDALLQRRTVFKEPIEISNVIIRRKDLNNNNNNNNEVYGHYIHQLYGPGVGKIVSLVVLKTESKDAFEKKEKSAILLDIHSLATKLAQHVAGMKTDSKEKLLEENYLFDESLTINQMLENYKTKKGINSMKIVDIYRLSIEND